MTISHFIHSDLVSTKIISYMLLCKFFIMKFKNLFSTISIIPFCIWTKILTFISGLVGFNTCLFPQRLIQHLHRMHRYPSRSIFNLCTTTGSLCDNQRVIGKLFNLFE